MFVYGWVCDFQRNRLVAGALAMRPTQCSVSSYGHPLPAHTDLSSMSHFSFTCHSSPAVVWLLRWPQQKSRKAFVWCSSVCLSVPSFCPSVTAAECCSCSVVAVLRGIFFRGRVYSNWLARGSTDAASVYLAALCMRAGTEWLYI